jgi:CBS domain-containing protein
MTGDSSQTPRDQPAAIPHPGGGAAPRRSIVDEVMRTDVTSVTPSTPLARVVDLMLRRRLRFVPVCENDRLVGVITNGDLVERAGLVVRLELQASIGTPRGAWSNGTKAVDVMTPNPIAVLARTPVTDVARIMLTRKVKRIPVLRAGRLVGVVSRVDLVTSALATHEMAEPANTKKGPPSGLSRSVGDIAVQEVPTVGPDTPLSEAVDVLVSTRLNRAIVIDADRRVVGVVSDAELLKRVGPAGRHLVDRLMRRGGRASDVAGTCADVMIKAPPVVAASTPVVEAIRKMVASSAKILPVVDEQSRLIGMLDRADALHAAFPLAQDRHPSDEATGP